MRIFPAFNTQSVDTFSLTALLVFVFTCGQSLSQDAVNKQQPKQQTKTRNVLFIGNSYTARHNLANVVKQLAEAADPELSLNPTQIIYGGRTLRDHWRFGTQHIVNRHRVRADEVKETITELESAVAANREDKYAPRGLARMRAFLAEIESGAIERGKWDWVVLQSYRDDLQGDDSLYMKFAPKFAALAKAQGAKVLLYETTPTTQNQFPIAQHQDSTHVLEKARAIGRLAKQTGAAVAPMSYVALKCQIDNPEVTLRFENDAHLNQTMAYLTACTMFAAMFDESPQGLPIDSITDIRFWNNDRSTEKDRDGKPIKKVFSEKERLFLQTTAWDAWQEFKANF